MNLSLEIIQALPVREMPLGRKARACRPKFGFERSARIRMYRPRALLIVPLGRDRLCVEDAILLDVQAPINMVEVFSQLIMVWVVRTPSPVLIDFWYGESVDRVLTIDASTWIAVPIPDAAQIRAGLLQPNRSQPIAHDNQCQDQLSPQRSWP